MKRFLSFSVAAALVLTLAFFVACTPQNADEAENGEGDNQVQFGEAEREAEPEQPRTPGVPWVAGNMVSPGRTVATVNGLNIGENDVNFRLQQADWQLHMQVDPFEEIDFEAWDDSVRAEAVRIAAVAILFRQYADENGLALPDFELEDIGFRVQDFLMAFDDEDEFVEMLAMDGIFGLSHLEYIFYTYAWVDLVIEHIISDPVLFAPYEEYIEELLGAKHILITPGTFEGDEDATYAFARDVWARAVAGEDFDTLMATYSEDPGLEMFPGGYTFSAGQMVPEFEHGTIALEIGEISEPIRSFHGYHIIQRVPPNPDEYQADQWSPPPTEEERMGIAVYRGFEAKVERADLVLLPELHELQLP